MIDNILGRIWLDSAEIVVFDKEEDKPDEPGVIEAVLIKFREKMLSRYRMHLPEPESSLVAGIILGYKKDIGREFYDKMIKSGTIHIAVASGYNIMLVGGTTLSICLWFLKRKKATIVSIFLMAVYALEAGGEPPVVRAVIMGIVVFLAACIGRKVISWWILLVTGWLMVIIEPLLLLDVSFQLSMAASVGLMIVEPCLRKKIENWDRRLSELVSGSGILSSVSTMAMTVPIIWYQFGRMSLIGILSNTLILPFVPLLMILGAGMQILPRLFFWPTYIMAHWIVGVIEFFGM
ncbi:MAG TPA: ComEC/Rec2 family competence protein [Candidatus Woesebacteria bacterium]|nr:ComEC/Rec2 family competence protein [Candidatus Woesebacteria bacterium]